MALVKLNIPTLVSDTQIEGVAHYYLRPFFIPYPIATHRRYENCVTLFRKEVRQVFKGFKLQGQNANQLLWFLFKPNLTYSQLDLEFTIGRQLISGKFAIAHFQMKGITFVSLPAFNNYMFIAHAGDGNRPSLEKSATKVVKTLMQRFKKEEENFKPEVYFATKREFITYIELSINIGDTPFQFNQHNDNWFFSSINKDSHFEGVVEIEKVGQDLNNLYPVELERAYLQDELAEQLYQAIFRASNTPIALVGPEGIGKHTVLQEAIWKYETYRKANKKEGAQRIWHVDPTRIISGMSIVGMWQKRFEAIIDYVLQPAIHEGKTDKLLFDNPVALLRIGKSAQNNMTLSDVLRPYLEKRQLQVIIIATPEEWKVVQEQGRRFSSLFRVIRMNPPSNEQAIQIILRKRKQLEQTNGTIFQIQAIQQLLDIQRNYLKNKALPGSVIKLMRQLAAKHSFQTVDAPEVRAEFQAYSGLQESIFDAIRPTEEADIKDRIAQALIGQDAAVETLAGIVHLIKAKLADRDRPLSSFLFIGPTGVGKTQAAKVLCQTLMGNEEALMRFDMNEYIDAGAVQRLIGDSYNPEGQLTGAVKYRPFGILLLDEIEKAHPLVHDLLLQVLDDGRLTDSLGRTIDFTNTVIIMTSNVGAREASVKLGYQAGATTDESVYRRAVELSFRPEFINRIDKIVIFKALALEHIHNIARLQIKELLSRDGFVRRATILNISTQALEWVAKRGYDNRMGGRALKRQIERDLTALSAEQLITTHSDVPILFDILLKDEKLVPLIRPLGFVGNIEDDWLPSLPDETQGRKFYSTLLNVLEYIKERLERFESEQENLDEPMVYIGNQSQYQTNWQYYHFKAKIEETKEGIQNIMLGFRDRYYKVGPSIPFRYKPVSLIPRRDWSTKGVRENVKDRLFQQEGIKEITEAYQYALVQFDSLKTEFISNFLRTSALQLQLNGVLSGAPDKCELMIYSYIDGMGQEEIAYLLSNYTELLKSLDISHIVNEEKSSIHMEGFSLRTLLEGEIGIHLFYTAHRNPLPIIVRFIDKKEENTREVVRIYDSGATLTDLRTGFSNAVNITSEELLLLVYAGLPLDLRRAMNPFKRS
jgi:ATP-dependent Clp protease ATP-binding subunit ClpC